MVVDGDYFMMGMMMGTPVWMMNFELRPHVPRSADEPMTTFVLCNECGKRWKFC